MSFGNEKQETVDLGASPGSGLQVTSTASAVVTNLDESADPILYVGSAVPGTATSAASWLIKKIDTTSGVVMGYANGSSLANQIWDNRASLTYS